MAKPASYLTILLLFGLFAFCALAIYLNHPGFAIRVINQAYWAVLILVLFIKISHEKK